MFDDYEFVTSRGSLQIRYFNALPECNTAGAVKLAVFLHPWSPLGGNMHDPVLSMIRRVFLAKGFSVLTYNSRFSMTGLPEAQDLKELVRGTITKLGRIDVLVLVGYSHGSLAASLHPLLPLPTKTFHVLVSYPLGVRSLLTIFNGSAYESGLKQLLQEVDSNVLVLYGDQDQFTSLRNYEQWTASLKGIAKGQFLAHMVANTDHFWKDTGGEQLCLVISQWLNKTVP